MYEGSWKEGCHNGKTKHGCGVWTWPSGMKVMQLHDYGKLIDSAPFTSDQVGEERSKAAQEEIDNYTKKGREILREETELLNREKELLNREKQQFQQIRQEFEEEKKMMAKFQDHILGWVKLNIGGILFQTSKGSLLKYQSFFSILLSGRYETHKDENGAILIDRDGVILNFLRDGQLPSKLGPAW
eukprot:TRINITY_DN7820_c0_g1_i1.p1 TRINITY_DN7820_c0_g1~~TRINITY_DN7820_c0_g1_i1.p1  ORF type:complete len:186 (-),score=35.91 TRINITY_DN7820_c0_g1_i1:101-658(-)